MIRIISRFLNGLRNHYDCRKWKKKIDPGQSESLILSRAFCEKFKRRCQESVESQNGEYGERSEPEIQS